MKWYKTDTYKQFNLSTFTVICIAGRSVLRGSGDGSEPHHGGGEVHRVWQPRGGGAGGPEAAAGPGRPRAGEGRYRTNPRPPARLHTLTSQS